MANTRPNATRKENGSGEQDIPQKMQEQVLHQVQDQVPPQVPNDAPIGNLGIQ